MMPTPSFPEPGRPGHWIPALALAVASAAVLPLAANAKTYTVNAVSSAMVNASACDSNGAGKTGTCTLGNAILALNLDADASGTATIEFDGRVFSQPQTIVLGSAAPLVPQYNVNIVGPGAHLLTVRGAPNKPVFLIRAKQGAGGNGNPLSVGLSGLNITGGQQGINNSGALTVDACVVSGNNYVASNATGGGIGNLGSLSLLNSTVSGNTINAGSNSGSGAGIYNGPNARMLAIANSTIANNKALGSSDSGGGVYNAAGNATSLTITNTTISGNSAQAFGGGLYHYTYGQAKLQLVNAIVAGNSARTSADLASTAMYTTTTTSVLNQDAASLKLAPLGSYGGTTPTMPPLAGSPAIGAGVFVTGEPAVDQIGATRPLTAGAPIDAGAVQGTAYALSFASPMPFPASVNPGTPAFAFRVKVLSGATPVPQVLPSIGLDAGSGLAFSANCQPTDASGEAACSVAFTLDSAAPVNGVGLMASFGAAQVRSPAFNVAAQTVVKLRVATPAQAAVGQQFAVTVTALDANDHPVPGYGGNVQFSSSDSDAVLPAGGALASGTASFKLRLQKLGRQTIVATDAADAAITGSTSTQVSLPPPTVESVSPGDGSPSGGTLVTIDGSNFDASARVFFGTSSVMPQSISPTQITVAAPRGTPGSTVAVQVYTTGCFIAPPQTNCVSATSAASAFAYRTLAGTALSLEATPNPAAQNRPLTLSATLSAQTGTETRSLAKEGALLPVAGGSVNFLDNGTWLGSAPLDANGKASWTISALSVGSHEITASYPGDDNYAAATAGPLEVTVRAVPGEPAPVPALSPWALPLLAGLLGTVATARRRRRT